MPPHDDTQQVRNAFLHQWRLDQRAGRRRTLEEYASLFPGNLEPLAAEFLARSAESRRDAQDDRTILGPYRTIEEIGRGGQGVVYRAEDLRFGRPVALKVLNGVGTMGVEVLARFRREAMVASRLDHPGICGVLDAEIDEGMPYIAMPFIEGQTLAHRIRESREAFDGNEDSTFVLLDFETEAGESSDREPEAATSSSSVNRKQIDEILEVFEAAARALHVAHEAGVVHRDLKPANLMIRPDGSPVILDFGLATATDTDLETLTQSGDLFGTPAYMSPEQVSRRSRTIDRRTDIYSLGASLFESLTLKRPFEAASREALFHDILEREAPFARTINARIPRDLSIVVSKTLEKDRERRYETAADLADELRRVRAREPIFARPAGPLTRTGRWAERNPVVATLLCSLILVLSTATILTARESRRTASALGDRERALGEKQIALAAEQDERREKEAALLEYERLADAKRLRDAMASEQRLWPVSPEATEKLSLWQKTYAELLHPENLARHEAALEKIRAQAHPYTDADWKRDYAEEFAEIARLTTDRNALVAALPSITDDDKRKEAQTQVKNLDAELVDLRSQAWQRRTWSFDDDETAFRHDILSRLVEDLRTFSSAQRPDAITGVPDRLARSRRIEGLTTSGEQVARAWKAASDRVGSNERYRIDAETRGKLGPIAAPEDSYDEEGFLVLRPQVGLIPLGIDPVSGLEEFLHLETHDHDWSNGQPNLPTRPKDAEGSPTGSVVMKPSTGVILVLIPAGTFTMGAQNRNPFLANYDPQAKLNEGPVHEVALSAYFISKYELTQAQWARASERVRVGTPRPSQYGLRSFANEKHIIPSAVDGTHPVEQVNWFECERLVQRVGLRLPTEAQWERAARATAPRNRWAGAGRIRELASVANICGMETRQVFPNRRHEDQHRDAYVIHAPVGTFAPNGFGLHDMTGNVWEWVRDPYGSYELRKRPGEGLRAANARNHLVRGGSFANDSGGIRVSYRNATTPASPSNSTGLRPSRPLLPN